jgi:pimeloyl-ACP methyl ester carboxylesterase
MSALVLLPGMMCDARLFAPQVAALSGSHDIVLPRLVGADSVPGLARRILELAPPRFSLAGLSMGGIVAMEVIAQAPERVERLALMDTNAEAEAAEIAARRAPQMAQVDAGHLDAVMRDEMKPLYLTVGPNRAQILDLCMEMALGLGPEVFKAQSRALISRPDQKATLTRVSVPTLVLTGAQDKLCPLHRHELMAKLVPGAQLAVIQAAGHLPTLEQPEATTAALKEWLGR